MKVYITKYALTKGIEHIEVKETSYPEYVKENTKWGRDFHKGDWWENKDDAIKKAEGMRKKKIASLEKQIGKLKKLEFI